MKWVLPGCLVVLVLCFIAAGVVLGWNIVVKPLVFGSPGVGNQPPAAAPASTPVLPTPIYDAAYAAAICLGTGVNSFNPLTGEVVCMSELAGQPTMPTPVAAAPSCGVAQELGPWAPNSDGSAENFEVTANETVSSGVHVQLWWPGGSGQAWEKKEISTFLPPGLSIEVQNGAGRGWEYPLGCTSAEINGQMDADHQRRKTDTSYYGIVSIDDLIAMGLVEVRFDRR